MIMVLGVIMIDSKIQTDYLKIFHERLYKLQSRFLTDLTNLNALCGGSFDFNQYYSSCVPRENHLIYDFFNIMVFEPISRIYK